MLSCDACGCVCARLIVSYCQECWERAFKNLRSLESQQNDGRGVSCVRSVITYLERGDIGSARAVADTDHDKIRNYPTIEDCLSRLLWDSTTVPKWWKRCGKK